GPIRFGIARGPPFRPPFQCMAAAERVLAAQSAHSRCASHEKRTAGCAIQNPRARLSPPPVLPRRTERAPLSASCAQGGPRLPRRRHRLGGSAGPPPFPSSARPAWIARAPLTALPLRPQQAGRRL